MKTPSWIKDRRGISTYLAVLLLIILAIVIGILLYAYMMGYLGMGNIDNTKGKAIAIQSAIIVDNELWIYVKNNGPGTISLLLGGNARVYLNTVSKTYSIAEEDLRTQIPEGRTCTIQVGDLDLEYSGRTTTIRVVTDEGYFAEGSYKLTYGTNLFRTITSSVSGTGGTITPLGSVSVPDGADQTFTITADPGYYISNVLVDGEPAGPVRTYTFTGVTANHNIVASFSLGTAYTITSSAGAGGSIIPLGVAEVVSGGSLTYTITADSGYHIADVVIDGITHLGSVASYTFTGVTADHTIDATFGANSLPKYWITVIAGAGGSITPETIEVYRGSTQAFQITPNSGYYTDNVIVNGYSQGAITQYTFQNVQSNQWISASFTLGTSYTITSSVGPGGTISPLGPVSVPSGGSRTFTINPLTGYHILDVVIDGTTHMGAITSYTFNSVSASHTIRATFAINTYTITASVSVTGGGTISPTGAQVVDAGNDITFSMTPNSGYYVNDVKVDGVSVGKLSSYTFTNVIRSHTIEVSFASGTFYMITSSAGPNGSINPLGSVYVPALGSSTFTITPNLGYRIENVLVDEASVGEVPTYTFTSVTGPHTIHATFVSTPIVMHTITSSVVGEGGTIDPLGTMEVIDGGSQTFRITAYPSYGISDVKVDGVSVGGVSTYTFDNVITEHTIVATFSQGTFHTITSSVDGIGGTIAPLGAVSVLHGNSRSFTITASAGYHIADVLVDGNSVGAVASYTFPSVTSDHTIMALFNQEIVTYTIAASVQGSGNISPSGNVIVIAGASRTFTITANSGNRIKDVTVDGLSVGAVNSYTFNNVVANHNIIAIFESGTAFTIIATADPGGAISPAGEVSVPPSGTPRFTITPNTGYIISDVLVDGISVGAVASYQFTPVSASHTIHASFSVRTFTITASTTDVNGAISPSGAVTVIYGASRTFTIIANTGYHIVDVKVNDVSVGAVSTYTFTNVVADNKIVASFAVGTVHTITSSAGTGGSITPLGAVSVVDGADQPFSISINPGYQIADLKIDGSSVTIQNPYTFTDVTADHTISVSFSERIYTLTITVNDALQGHVTVDGHVVVAPSQHTYPYGAQVKLTAVAENGGYTFSRWEGDETGTANPITVIMNGDKTINAVFGGAQTTSIYWYDLSAFFNGDLFVGDTYSAIGILYHEDWLFGGINNRQIRLVFTKPDGTEALSTTTTTQILIDGVFYAEFTPDVAGDWTCRAQFLGDSTYGACTSEVVGPINVKVNKIDSTLTCTVAPSTVGPGEPVTVSGTLTPTPALNGQTVTLTFTQPDASQFTATALTGTGGAYTYSYTPNMVGSWSLVASWAGTYEYNPDASTLQHFTVALSGVLDHFVFSTIASPKTAGTPFSITITAKDGYGATVTSYIGTNTLAASDGTINPSSTTAFTAGVWTGSVTLASAGPGRTISTTGATKTGTSNSFTVNPAPATRLVVSGYPNPAMAGTPGTVTVTAQDTFGNTATGYTGRVRFTSTDGAATLPGDHTFQSSDNGVHTFSVTLRTIGTRSITVTDTSTSSITGSQTGIVVNVGSPATLLVNGFADPVVAGTAGSITVTAKDANGNTVAGYTGTVHFTSTDSAATLPNNYAFVAGDNGVHTFTNGATLKTIGEQWIRATDTVTGSITGSQTAITVTAGPLDHFTITGYPATVTAGQTFGSNNVVVTAYDINNNIKIDYTGQVYFTSTDTAAVLPYILSNRYTFTSGDRGQHSFPGTGFTLKTVNTQTITVTTGTVSVTSNPITVNKATATVGTTTFTPSGPITKGGTVTLSVTVTGAAVAPTGTVTFQYRIGTGSWTTITPNAVLNLGTASQSFTTTSSGSHTFRAIYNGDSNYVSGTTGGVSNALTVNPIYHYVNAYGPIHDSAIGSHSNFANMQNDGSYDILAEADTDSSSGTMGVSSTTGTNYITISGDDMGGGAFTAGGSGVIQSVTFYGRSDSSSNSRNVKVIITDSSGNILTNGISNVISVTTTAQDWTATFASPPIVQSGGTYWIMIIPSGSLRLYYQSTTGGISKSDTSNNYNSPSSPTDASSGTYNFRRLYANVNYNNYQLDLEVQFSGVSASFTQLEIKTGNLGTENLAVYYWGSGSWHQLTNSLTANAVNTYTVSPSSTFELRFYDATRTSDATQNSWEIDYARLADP